MITKLTQELNSFLFFRSRFFNFLINNNFDNKIIFNPESLWKGNKTNGNKILEGFLNYQKETIYIGEKIWGDNHGSQQWTNYANSFKWISDIRLVATNEARVFLRKNIIEWINTVDLSDQSIWNQEVLSKRIFYLLTNLSFFFETANEKFQKDFAENLNKQCIFLIKKFQKEKKNNKDIFSIKSIILASLCFNNLKSYYDFSIDLLIDLINHSTKEGMHYLRSPSEHFFLLCSLIDIKNFLGSNKKKIPHEINQSIEEMTIVVNFFIMGDGRLAIFNKYDFINDKKIVNVLKKGSSKVRIPKISQCSGFHRISKNKLIFLMDCGNPTKEKTYAGSLSFEFSHFSERIVVNCGSPFINNRDWNDAMRSTAAHSSLNINEINSSDIFFEKDTTTRLAQVYVQKSEREDNLWLDCAHTGYLKLFGITHRRKIHIDPNNFIIRGEESFLRNKKNKKNNSLLYFLRFHLHPSIEVNVTTSKKKAVIKLRNNIGWEFICSESKIEIGDGIYLGDNKIVQPNQHIIIKNYVEDYKNVKWLFRLIK